MITFQKIRWKNFLSTGNQFTEIDFQQNNTNLIIGTNGAGKSTMLDALTFVLFNKPFRKINKPQLINTTNERDCLVEIEFEINSKLEINTIEADITFKDSYNKPILTFSSKFKKQLLKKGNKDSIVCQFEQLNLIPGKYNIHIPTPILVYPIKEHVVLRTNIHQEMGGCI